MFANEDDFKTVVYEKGEILFKEGESVRTLFLLRSGTVKLISVKNDRIVPLYTISERGVIGEDCIFKKDTTCNYSAVVSERASVVEIPRRDLIAFINSSSDWMKNIIFDMADKSEKTAALIVEHRILDDRLNGNSPFSDEEEVLFKTSLAK